MAYGGSEKMSLSIEAEPLPLRIDRDGTVRVGGTRVTLDTIVGAFLQGAAAEEIAQQYPTVSLGDVYAVVAYYLRHRAEVDEYLAERQREAESLRKEIEANLDRSIIRERLLARRASKP